MAKLPKYIKLKMNGNLSYTLTIKKWGLPIIIFKAMKKNYNLKWYHWIIFYPYLCFKAIRGD